MDKLLIKKCIVQAGNGPVPDYPNETKIKFHYVTRTVGEEVKVIDDSRKHKEPMELIIGKKFKFEPWEECLKTMAANEISSYIVDRKLTCTYPVLSKSIREIFIGKKAQASSHCCAMTTMAEGGLGYDDLNELMTNPQPLEFILEILEIEEPGSYKKEAWAMDSDEKTKAIPRLKEEGNALYKDKEYRQASEKYSKAIGLLERLIMQEKPESDEQKGLEILKVPLLLNYAQCLLLLEDYYPAIQHTTDVLKISPDNVKAFYRRARANAKVWNVTEARQDYKKALELDSSMANLVKSELLDLDERVKKKDAEDMNKLRGKLFN